MFLPVEMACYCAKFSVVRPRSWNLWDTVNKFNLFDFGHLIAKLERMATVLENVAEYGGKGGIHDPALYAKSLELISEVLTSARANAFHNCASTIESCESHLRYYKKNADISTLAADVRHTRDALIDEAFPRTFLRVVSERANYVDQEALFGTEVRTAFPIRTSRYS
jgi:hypothetical protein